MPRERTAPPARIALDPTWLDRECRPAEHGSRWPWRRKKRRPFEPLHMTTADWLNVKLAWVMLDQLVFCQDEVSIQALLALAKGRKVPGRADCSDEYPHVVEHQGTLYVEDGHHRVVHAMLQGRKNMRVRRLRLSQLC